MHSSCDTQPLLSNTASKSSSSNTNEVSRDSLFRKWWYHIWEVERNSEYETLDKTDGQSFNISQCFHFADRSDHFFLLLGIFGSIIYSISFLINVNMFSRVTASFASQSFISLCDKEMKNISLFGSVYVSEFYDQQRDRVPLLNESFTSTSQWLSFRESTMKKIYIRLLCGTFSCIGIFIMHYTFEYVAGKQVLHIRQQLFKAILRYKISYFDVQSASRLNTKMFDDVEKLQLGIGYRLSILLATCMTVIGGIIMVLCVNWQLTMIMLFSIPLICIGTQIFFKHYGKETRKEIESYSKAGAIAEEVFSSIRTVLSFNGTHFEQKRYEDTLKCASRSPIRKGILLGFVSGWLYFIKYLIYGIGFLCGYLLLYSKEQSTSNLNAIALVVFTFGTCILNISFITHFLQSSVEALSVSKKIFPYILTEDFEYTSTEGSHRQINQKKPIDNESRIEFVDVQFAYPARSTFTVLKDVSFVAHAGKVTAFVGSSGAGKSTILALLLRYYNVASGQILLNKCPVEEYDLHAFRRRIGVVNQEPFLFSTSIYENIRFGNENATREEIYAASVQANAYDFIMDLPKKFDTVVGERGIQMSGGERQRIALARALVKKPHVLFLDEATSSLDTVNEKLVQEALDRASEGRTTIVIAHRLTSIRNAHHIYVMDRGQIIEQGTHDSLMLNRGKYYQLFEAQLSERIYADTEIDSHQAQHDSTTNNFSFTSKHRSDIIEAEEKEMKNSPTSKRRSVFWRLLRMNSSEWPFLFIGYLACIFIGASQSIYAFLLSRILQAFGSCTTEERSKSIMNFSCSFLLLGIGCLLTRLIQYSCFAFSGSKFTERIRIRVFQSLLRQEIAYFDRLENNSASVCSRLASNASALQEMSGTRLGSLIEAFSMLIIATVLGFLFNVPLALISLIFVIFTFIVVFIHIKSYAAFKKETNAIYERANSIVAEAIHNMRTVKQLGIEDLLFQQYSNMVEDVFRIRRKHLIVATLRFAIGWNLPSFCSSALYALAIKLVENQQLNSQNMILVLSFVMFFFQSTQIFFSLSNEIGASLSAAKVFFDLFDRRPAIDNSSIEGQQLTDFHGHVNFDRVTFAYPTRNTINVLHNLCINIERGQRIALVGPSGSGKTTVIQLLERFYDCTHGRILLDGLDIREMNIQWIRSHISLVSQEPVLFDLSIAENIAYGLENTSLDKIIEAATQANIHSFIEQLPQSYETNVGPKGTLLSIGQKQRLAIARAILRRPSILLLDEATSAMDSQNEQVVQQTLEKIQGDGTRTTIIVAHRLSTVRSCHQIYVFQKGHIVENGDHEKLMSQRGLYYSMVIQAKEY